MANNEQSTYEILLKFGLDDSKARTAIEELKKIEQANKKTSSSTKESGGIFDSMFGKLGKQIAGAVAGYFTLRAAINSISGAMNQYVQQAGTSESTSREWLQTTQEIEFATTRLGRTTVEALLPVYKNIKEAIVEGIIPALEKAISLTGKAVDWVNKQYEKAAESGVDILAGVQANTELTYKEYKQQYAYILQSIQSALSPEEFKFYGNQQMSEGERARAMALYERTGIAPSLKGMETEDDTFKTIQEYEMMLKYKRQEEEANKAYENQQYRMKRDWERSERYATEDFQKQRYRSLRDYQMQIQYSENEFYRQRSISLRDFNISLSRSEYDYQLSRKRAQEDHNFSLKQIMLSGDALQYYYSQRQYNIEKKRAEEDYQLQRKRSVEDFQRQQNDQLVQYQISRAFQLKQFEISLSDQNEDFKIQRKRSLEQYKIQLNDLQYSFLEQRRLRQQAYRDQYNQMLTDEERLLKLKAQFTQYEIDYFTKLASQGRDYVYDLGVWLAQINNILYKGTSAGSGSGTGGTVKPFADGGYSGAGGLAILHPGEYILNPKTTKAAEQLAKDGRLTQDSILQAMGAKSGLTYVDNREFSRGLSADEKIMIKNELRQMIVEAFA